MHRYRVRSRPRPSRLPGSAGGHSLQHRRTTPSRNRQLRHPCRPSPVAQKQTPAAPLPHLRLVWRRPILRQTPHKRHQWLRRRRRLNQVASKPPLRAPQARQPPSRGRPRPKRLRLLHLRPPNAQTAGSSPAKRGKQLPQLRPAATKLVVQRTALQARPRPSLRSSRHAPRRQLRLRRQKRAAQLLEACWHPHLRLRRKLRTAPIPSGVAARLPAHPWRQGWCQSRLQLNQGTSQAPFRGRAL
mmetsp:Transcript_23077/g.87280  ORF Transcript_23077/g.87280 Transcript_23077/m.87280 type:complete len:243 (+) Transcript_23077:830-1558(+)